MVTDLFETEWAKEGRIQLLEHSGITINVPGRDSWNIFGSPYWAPMGVTEGGEKEKSESSMFLKLLTMIRVDHEYTE